MKINGYYFDGKNSYTIYQDKYNNSKIVLDKKPKKKKRLTK
tara:strand:+ start:117 stop:239 length:123 start_codon:yes stop_codon:yes gene_type:complete